ncbi:thiamine pyrophosphate-dependent enzyme [Devosia sp. A16]|uniref:thiamine pyrophosphate-dependent enzyme n=1 Tax=Devosia sp. A16 TaxID=1736675 RepID=UPI0006D7B034|nr:thiamine pyrophosphate-binding protein [Devosia sp. A16]
MPTAADILIETLLAWDVEVIFGLPGDGINGIMEALRKRQDRIRFVQVRHEESAAFMACAYAKWTGKLGVCLATSGPGGTHLLTGLYDAKLDQVPVLAITGMQFHDLIETFTQQDVDLTRAFNDVAEYNVQVSDAAHMENAASLACRTALSRHGVAHLSVANDVQEEDVGKAQRSKRNKPGHVSNTWFAPVMLPPDGEIERAAEILNGASRVAMLVGRGALRAGKEVEEASGLLNAPIAKALLGKTVVSDHHPNTTGVIGILGTRASQEIMEQCDALLIVGSTFPYIEYYPQPGKAKVVQIDWNPERIGLRCPVEVGLVGHAGETLRRLNGLLDQKPDRSFLTAAQRSMNAWRDMMSQAEAEASSPLKPQMIVRRFGERMASDAILATDSGQNTELTARHVDLDPDHAFAVSGTLASMSCGLTHAIAAGIAYPGRQVCAVVGDGGLAMQLGEFSTAVRYGIPLKLLVIKNNMLNQIAWEQMMFLGNPQFGCELQPIDFALAAVAMGGKGFSVERPEDIDAVLDAAFAEPGPVIVEALVDRYVPMLPPKVPADYRSNFHKALPETPGRAEIEGNIAREPLATMFKG